MMFFSSKQRVKEVNTRQHQKTFDSVHSKVADILNSLYFYCCQARKRQRLWQKKISPIFLIFFSTTHSFPTVTISTTETMIHIVPLSHIPSGDRVITSYRCFIAQLVLFNRSKENFQRCFRSGDKVYRKCENSRVMNTYGCAILLS